MSISSKKTGYHRPEVSNVTLPMQSGRRSDSDTSLLQMVVVLFKLRIVLLLLFAGVAAAFLGAAGWVQAKPLVLLFFCGGLAAAGASALNQYLEQPQDRAMKRTRQRPLVTGKVSQPSWVLAVGLALIVLPVLIVLPINASLALWSLLGAIIYVGVYTLWLKPRTTLNIVIGGLAGSCAVLSGGAAVGEWSDPGVIALALLLFLWTPTHFWSLAIVYRDDYANANVPMLPTRVTIQQSAGWIFFHTAATGVMALLLGYVSPLLGLVYWGIAVAATGYFLFRSFQLLSDPTPAKAKAIFMASNSYLALILLAICMSTVIHTFF